MKMQYEIQALSSVYGRLRHIFLVFPGSISGPDELYRKFRGLIQGMPRGLEYTVLALQSKSRRYSVQFRPWTAHVSEFQLESSASGRHKAVEAKFRCILVDTEDKQCQLHRWAQDYFYVLKRGDQTLLLNTIRIDSRGKNAASFVAEYLASCSDFYVKPFRFEFEGGDILVADDYLLAGKSLIQKNYRQESFHNVRDLKRHLTPELCRQFGVETVLWLDEEIIDDSFHVLCSNEKKEIQSLLHHIDLYVTLGGRSHNNAEIIFIAQVQDRYCHESNRAMRPVQYMRQALNRLAANLADKTINGRQFEVVRLPMVIDYKNGPDARIIPRSFNNCLVEVYDNVKRMYLPDYTSDDPLRKSLFDRAKNQTARILRKHHFKLKFIDYNFVSKTDRRGSLHCLVKVLERANLNNRHLG